MYILHKFIVVSQPEQIPLNKFSTYRVQNTANYVGRRVTSVYSNHKHKERKLQFPCTNHEAQRSSAAHNR